MDVGMIFPEGHYGILPKFFYGRGNVVKFVFSHSKSRKQPFLLKISKSSGEFPPLPTLVFAFLLQTNGNLN